MLPDKLPLPALKQELQELLGSRFSGITLFGSYARGDERADSDVDLLLVITHTLPYLDDMVLIIPIISRYLLEYGILFSLIIKTEEELTWQNEGLMRNIELEGVPL